jgi:hypothetical protein
MPWVRIEATALSHPKLVAVKGAGMLLYLRSIGYAASHLTDGAIPKDVVPSLVADFVDLEVWPDPCRRAVAGSSPRNGVTDTVSPLQGGDVTDDERKAKRALDRRRQRLVRRLVEVGLWEETPDGYAVHDYLDYQPTAADSKAAKDRERERTRERVRRHRAKKKAGGLSPNGRNPDDVTVTTKRVTPKGVTRLEGSVTPTTPIPSGGSSSESAVELERKGREELSSLVSRLAAGKRVD